MKTLSAFLLATAVLVGPGGASSADLEPLIIEDEEERHHFRVEIADDAAERARGLMFRKSLAADRGMLFDFRRERMVSMWMKNTPISLDMLFIDEEGEIVRMARDMVPFSEDAISSGQPVRAVLEIPGGTSERLGIELGERVIHPLFD